MIYELAGLGGVFLYVGSYGALQLGFLNGHGYAYASINLIAASCVLTSLAKAFNLWSALIEISWITISVVGMVRFYYLMHRIRFTPEEQAVVRDVLSSAPKIKARRFLDLGHWISGDSGDVLTEEGEPVAHLIYLSSGEAEVSSGGRTIASCREKSFIGEMTAIGRGGDGLSRAVAAVALLRDPG